MSECQISQSASAPARERREDIRVVVSLPGRYILPKRRGLQGHHPEYACRLVNISPRALVLAGPVIGTVGEPAISYFEEFGKLEGAVLRTLYGGFVVTIEASAAKRAKLESKLIWLEKHQREELPNARRHKRVVPQNPHSMLILADGTTLPCFVIDMSASGAAVSADIRPPVGMPLAVGRVVGRVVRHFAQGFAVHFVQPQEPRFVEQLVLKPLAPPSAGPGGLELSDPLALDAGASAGQSPVRA